MKRLLLVVALVVLSVSIFAQATPYGSVRAGFWYDYQNEDHYPHGDSNLSMRYFLQSNSRLGVNYRHDQFDGRIEMGMNNTAMSLRLLYGRQDFGGWSLLVGQDVILGTDFQPNQVGGPSGDLSLNGYGTAWGGRVPQVRFEMDNGFFGAFVIPNTANDPAGNSAAVNALIPRINLGYKVDLDNIKITPAVVFQYYDYNEDIMEDGGSVMSWIGAVTAEMNFEPVVVNAQFNIGSNIGNMGYTLAYNRRAGWDAEESETIDVLTFGGFLTATFAASPTLNFTLGGGYTANTMDDWDNPDDRMSIYLQSGIRAGRLRITPEVGMLNEMADFNDNDRGMLMYFGTQLRYDF